MQVGDLVKLKESANIHKYDRTGIVIEKNYFHGFPAKIRLTVMWTDGLRSYKVPIESLEVVSSCETKKN